MFWRKRGKVYIIAALLIVLFFISNKAFYRRIFVQDEDKKYKLNEKRSFVSDLPSEKKNIEGGNKKENKDVNSVKRQGKKSELHERDRGEKREESYAQR